MFLLLISAAEANPGATSLCYPTAGWFDKKRMSGIVYILFQFIQQHDNDSIKTLKRGFSFLVIWLNETNFIVFLSSFSTETVNVVNRDGVIGRPQGL